MFAKVRVCSMLSNRGEDHFYTFPTRKKRMSDVNTIAKNPPRNLKK